MIDRFTRQRAVLLCVGATTVWSALWHPALAATHEQIVESCREALHPQIMACAQAKGLRGNPEAVRQQCGMGIVQACVLREEQKQASHTAVPAAPKGDTEIVPDGASPVQPVFVAPPRTIADITAVLDSEKPDPVKIAQRQAEANAAPPANAAPGKIAQFYYDRGNARALLAQNKEALADGLQALTISKAGVDFLQAVRIQQFVGLQYSANGDPKQAIAQADETARFAEQNQRRGAMINALGSIARIYVSIGDVTQAGTYAGRVQALVQEARGSPSPKWRAAYPIYGHSWEADADETRGIVLEARGQYTEAEAAFRRAEAFRRASLKDLAKFDFPPPHEQVLQAADTDLSLIARNESKQGRLSEAEADARRALLEMLNTRGKYSPATPRFIVELAGILVEQGRYPEAEQLARSALDVQRTIGIADDAPTSVSILSHLGNILVLEGKTQDASTIYAELSKAIAQWPAQQREAFEINGSRIIALYEAGQIDRGIAAAAELVKRQTTRTGPNSYDTASARGTLALGYARGGHGADAIREFKAAIPVLMTGARDNSDDDDPTLVAARDARLQRIVEAYIGVLAHGASPSNDVAAETFSLADAVRGRAVQQSLADSNARAIAKDPALAELVRKEQDFAKQTSAELGTLNNLLALPSDQRGDQSLPAINAEIGKLRADRKAAQDEIKRRFPAYADLVDPKPPTVDEIKATLRPGEAVLSFYFGRDATFVWAVPKDGAVAFAAVPATQAQIAVKIHKLRESLEPQGSMVSDIAPFDLTLAYDLYATLLKPVESGWKPARSLIVATNGALGELPLSLLPTAPSQVDIRTNPPFAGYRDVPWLARTHAVTVIPSVSALVTLRRLPPASANRDKFIGFGDPYFNTDEEAEADSEQSSPQVASAAPDDGPQQVAMRGIPLKLRSSPHVEEVDKAELTMLPRLPDTRDELTAMARALDVDPAKTLYLGKAANEQNVETLDLSHYRVIAFATHGLVPGDIDGLTQPALALTEPNIAGIKGDGLLTMEEILALKLDADWVVLSACNTAAGAGAGAEAASGLGSAFFYAGSRALLVTNWSVQSTSARELTTDLFRRQAADPSLSRGEALQQAMMALLDGPGAVDASGQTVYTYAHPLFWAPYSVIGDGGGS